MTDTGKHRNKLTVEQRRDVVKLYTKGARVAWIADLYGCTNQNVCALVRARQLPMRGFGYPRVARGTPRSMKEKS